MNKKITIDELARMVQDGFTESKSYMDGRFTEMRTEMDEQFAQVNQELRTIRKELGGIVYRPEFEALQDQVRDLQHLVTLPKKKTA